MGRAISPALSSTLLMIHDDYGLPVEVIIMLLMYSKVFTKTTPSILKRLQKTGQKKKLIPMKKQM